MIVKLKKWENAHDTLYRWFNAENCTVNMIFWWHMLNMDWEKDALEKDQTKY